MKQQVKHVRRNEDTATKQQSDDKGALSTRRSTSSTFKSSSLTSSAISSSSTNVYQKRVNDLFRRFQPHLIVQSTEKLLTMLRITPTLLVHGEELLPQIPPSHTIAVAASKGSKQHVVPTTAAWRFKPDAGRFRYAMSFQYAPLDSELTLSSLSDVRVTLVSSAMSSPRCIPINNDKKLSSTMWRLVAETDRRVGLELYELPLGDWHASSLIALVWTPKCEVARFLLQLHTTELLYSAPYRALPIRRDDDVDRTHGLHSYTAAISLRSLDELFWEREIYQVEFPTPATDSRRVVVQLLDDINGGSISVRDRMLATETEALFRLETEAIKHTINNCFLLDFTLWDADCIPVWGFTRLKEAQPQQQNDDDKGAIDLSVSSLGGRTERFQIQYEDEYCGNELDVKLTKLPASESQHGAKKSKVWVSQIELALSLEFINTTFGTKY